VKSIDRRKVIPSINKFGLLDNYTIQK